MGHSAHPEAVRRRTLLGLGLGAAGVVAAGLAAREETELDALVLGRGVSELYGMRTEARRTYADLPGRAGAVDVYLPAGSGPFPVLAWNAGSGWREDRGFQGGQDVARGLVPAGYAVAAFSVRSSRQAVFPAQVLDVTAAVRWVRAHAGQLGLDPGRVAVGGNSSGGWNALMAGLTGGRDLDRASVPVPGTEVPEGGHRVPPEDAVQAIVDFFAPVDFLRMRGQMLPGACAELDRRQGLTQCHSDPRSTKSRMLGVPVLERPDLVRLASPRVHLTPQSPPVLMVHGLADREVPWGQSEALYRALVEHDVRSAFYSVPGAGHDLGMMRRGRGQARVRRHGVSEGAVREAISWAAVAAFLDEVMPAAPA